jgi:hypothetical protein
METVSGLPVGRNRSPVRRLSGLVALIGVIGLLLGLLRAWPAAYNVLIALAVFGSPAALLARKTIAGMRRRGEAIRIEDCVALFLSLSLFTVPIQLFIFSQLLTYRGGWVPGPVGRIIYRWWLTVAN